MATNTFRMRSGLLRHPKTYQVAEAIGKTPEDVLVLLYLTAEWIRSVGKYGILKCDPHIVNVHFRQPGFAEALLDVGWLQQHGQILRAIYFTDVSSTRKSLGRVIREQILASGVCAACNCIGKLVIDHKVPVSRGGDSELDNLQALCRFCNGKKGTKTMEEFLCDR